MNLFRSSKLIIIGVFLLVAERIYIANKNSPATPEDSKKTTTNAYSKYLQNGYTKNTANSGAVNTETERVIVHNPGEGMRFLPTSNVSAGENTADLWRQYNAQMPKVYMVNNAARNGVDYSEDNVENLKRLANDGDILAQFLYAYHLNKALDAEMLKNGGVGNAMEWASRIKEIRELYILSASQGVHASAHELSRLYSQPKTKDIVESLAWALIADAMRGDEDKSVESICTDKSNACTNDVLSRAFDKAQNYLKTYTFKLGK